MFYPFAQNREMGILTTTYKKPSIHNAKSDYILASMKSNHQLANTEEIFQNKSKVFWGFRLTVKIWNFDPGWTEC